MEFDGDVATRIREGAQIRKYGEAFDEPHITFIWMLDFIRIHKVKRSRLEASFHLLFDVFWGLLVNIDRKLLGPWPRIADQGF